MHYFTFRLADDGQDDPAAVLRREMSEGDRFAILAPGETFRANTESVIPSVVEGPGRV